MFDLTNTCSDTSLDLWGIFDFTIAPPLLFYSYVPIILISLILAFFVLSGERYSLVSKLFFLICLSFSLLLLNEIIQWIAAPVSIVMLGWMLISLFRLIIAILTVYFVFVYIKGKDIDFWMKILFSALYIITLLFISTDLNIIYFDIENCEGAPGVLWDFINLIATLSSVYLVYLTFAHKGIQENSQDRKRNYLVGVGATGFIIFFFLTSAYGDLTEIYDVAIIGPIGMLAFMVSITFAIVKYRAFNIKLAPPVVLVLCLWILVFSLLFINDPTIIHYIEGGTLIPLGFIGISLIKSIRREINSKEEAQRLSSDLQKANVRLQELDKAKSEFVSIASHQLRSPITAISGYASLIREGTYGEITAKLREPLDRIEQSARMMASLIEDYLNVSRIESGNMKYNYSSFSLHTEANHISDDLRPNALKLGLVLLYKQSVAGSGLVSADIGKTQQVIHNLVNNSIKYTPKGAITVYVHDDLSKKRIYVDIIDTGIGMSAETINSIFGKFSRGSKANSVNVTGTGLGLYVALKMALAMGGNITAHSEGEDKGSTFTFELPLG